MGSGLPWKSGEILLGTSVAIVLFQAASKVALQGPVGPTDFWRSSDNSLLLLHLSWAKLSSEYTYYGTV